MTMKKNTLGITGIRISELGYGCAALFGKDVMGKQGLSEEDALILIGTALEKGVNFFDTGFNYGYAEERLGRCLAALIRDGKTARKDVVIETKCGETLQPDGSYGPYNWSPDWIRRSVEISLHRMKTDYIDLLAMHGGAPEFCTDALLRTFQDLKAQGIIHAYGVNSFDARFLEWVYKERCFDYVMLDYNILKQDREPIIQKFEESGIGVIAGMALGQSLFVKKKIQDRNDIWYRLRALAHFRDHMRKAREFRFLTEQKKYSGNQLALRYVLDNPHISSAVFSTIHLQHLLDDLSAAEIVMPEQIRREIIARA